MQKLTLAAAISLIATAAATRTMAQQADQTGSYDPRAERRAFFEDGGVAWTTAAGGAYRTEADIDSGGDAAVARFGTGLGASFGLAKGLLINARLGYELDSYDFGVSPGAPTALAGGAAGVEPWQDIHSMRFRVNAIYEIDDKWSVFGGPVWGFSAEDGADLSEAWTVGGLVGGGYRFSEDLFVSVGVFVTSQLEDDVTAFPIVQFKWKIDQQWTLQSGRFDLGSSGGAGLELAYAWTEAWTVAGGMQFQSRRFRLNDDGPFPDGVGEDTSIPVYVRVVYKPSRDVEASLFGGVVVGGELELDNAAGNRVDDQDYDTAGLFGGRLTLRF